MKTHLCPSCGRSLQRKIGPSGFYWGCSYYPKCRKTLYEKKGKPFIPFSRKKYDYTCPICKEGNLIKCQGKNGKIWNCSRRPYCYASFRNVNRSPKIK